MFFKKNQKGRSMIEMLGVLAIMGIITALAVKAISGGSKSVKMNSYKSEILSIVSDVKELYGDDADYDDVDDVALGNMGLTGTGVLDTFSDATVSISGGDSSSNFDLDITFVETEDCSLIATMQDVVDTVVNRCSASNQVHYEVK